jgi:NAD(P)-dependent dehydrogenase (short-subunit alcohol dehydrogenase family)
MDLKISDRRALVFGASKGLGKAVARELIAEGVRVAIVSRDSARIAATVTFPRRVTADRWSRKLPRRLQGRSTFS